MYASTHALTLGTEHRGLQVAWSPGVPPPANAGPSGVAATPAGLFPVGLAGLGSVAAGSTALNIPPPTTPSSRLAAARAAGAANAPSEVHVACRDVLVALSFYATRCDAMLLGVANHGGYVEVACRYEDPGMAPDAVALGIRLPVKDLGAGPTAAAGMDAEATED